MLILSWKGGGRGVARNWIPPFMLVAVVQTIGHSRPEYVEFSRSWKGTRRALLKLALGVRTQQV